MSTINKGGYDSPTNVSPVTPIRHVHNAAAMAAVPSALALSSDAILPHLSGQPNDDDEFDDDLHDINEQTGHNTKPPEFDDDLINPNLYFGEESAESTNTYPFFYKKAREAAAQNGISLRDSIALPRSGDSQVGTLLDWNESFQTLLELPEDTKEQMLDKQEKLSYLAADFVYMAKRFSKIIISEASVPNPQKTVKKCNVGGRAGGIKYIYNGILFKLQTDFAEIYGGDFFAMKTGGLELKGVMRYYGCKGLHVPLMAVIDYRGYRVVAESILPITNETLVYGSADGGNTIKDGATHEYLTGCMKEAAQVLNIDGHMVGKPTKFIHGPVDIEAHKGQDGRYYVIDFARVFPPTAEPGVTKTFLYKVMRPEFVKRYKKPLSSDAYSPFVRGQKDEEEHNMRVLKATDFLLNVTINQFATWLDDNFLSINLEDPLSNLTELIHREGINCRYLGILRKRLSHDYPRELVLNEMIARVLKNNLRSELRQTMRRNPTLVEHIYQGVVLHFFNMILGIDDRSQSFWKEGLRVDVEEYFGEDMLDDIEIGESLRGHVEIWRLFKRLQQLTGVKLTQQALKELSANPDHFKLVSPDIKKMAVRVKHMNITYLAEASALAIQAMDYLEAASKLPAGTGAGHHHHDRLFELAMNKFEQAVRSTPDNTILLNHYAKVLERMALMKAQAGEESFAYFDKAYERYNVARNHGGLLQLGDVLRNLKALWNEREKIFSLANKCYQGVTSADRVNSEALCKWGDLLVNFARVTGNDTTYSRAGSMYRSSITLRPMIEFEWIASWHHHMKDEELTVMVELLHTNKQESMDANKCFKKSFVTDNVVIQMANYIGSSLKELILDDCMISDEAVIKVSKSCPNLVHLSLKRCLNLSDNAFGHISNLTKLTKISISGCPKLTSFSFKFIITKLEDITHFDVSHCQFKENFIGNLSTCASQKLQSINLSQQRFSPEAWCRAISHMTLTHIVRTFIALSNPLEEILLDECIDITDQCIAMLAQKAPNLKKVSLDSCVGLTDAAVFSLSQNCTHLREMFLSGCLGMTSRCLTYLGTFFTHLDYVALERCPKMLDDISGTVFFFSNNLNLTRLHLAGTAADDALLDKLSLYCKHIVDISLASTNVTSKGFGKMLTQAVGGSKLRRVILDNCAIDDEAISSLAQSAETHLTELSVAGCGKLSDGSVALLGKFCSSLERLDLSNCVDVNDVSIESIARGCPSLTYLILSECKMLTDASIEAMGNYLHRLRVLNISHCLLISRIGPVAIGCPDLTELHLQCCDHLENDGMDKLAQLKFLRLLDIRECSHVKDGLVMALFDSKGCPALEELRLGRNKMEDTLIKRLQEARPKLRIEGVNYTRQVPTSPNPLNTSGSREKHHLRRASSIAETEGTGTGGSSPSTSSSISPNATALRALMHDLKEIVKNPLPLVSARPLESNMLIWHGNLLGPENTPFAGAVFHIQLTFPETYPSMAPSATIFTSLPHPHVHNGRICLDILSDFSNFFAKQNSGDEVMSGWSSAYSVQTILLQLQTFLMELKAEEGESLAQFLQKIPAAIREAHAFSCSQCPHTPASPWPSLAKEDNAIINADTPKSEADVIKDELKCFHTRVSFAEDVLGVGVSVKYHKRNSDSRKDIEELNSPLDLLSRHAFYDLGVRESVYANHMQEKELFTHWLPLYINQEHGKRATELLRESLSLICTNQRDAFKPAMALIILPKLMNTMVVNVMSGRVHASIKALEGYCAMQRLLIYFVHQYPQIKETANRLVSNFAKNTEYRTKIHVPSLGDFLALLSVTDLQWKSVAKAYIEENFVRNVRWVVQKYPELSEQQPDPQIDNNRSRKTLLASIVSIRLVMFHVYFLENVGRPPGKNLDQIAESYDKLFGRPNNVSKDHFLRAIKEIISIDDWEDVFKWIGLECPEPPKFNEWLRQSITTSLKLGYHKPGGVMSSPRFRSPTNPGSSNLNSGGGFKSPAPRPSSTQFKDPRSPLVAAYPASATAAQSPSKKREVCKFWAESGGKECKYGNRCKYLHSFDNRSARPK